MRVYLSLLKRRKRMLLIKYMLFKIFLITALAAYYLYINGIINFIVWLKGLAVLSFIKLGFIAVVFSVVYSLTLIAAFSSNVYDYNAIYLASMTIINSFFRIDVAALDNLLAGTFILSINELLLMLLGFMLWLSVLFNISFIAKGRVSHFMWSLALILLALVGLEAMGYANIAVSEWPPTTIGGFLSNSMVILAILTFIVIEVCGNLAYASTIIDGYTKKIDRLGKGLHEILLGKVSSENTIREREEEIRSASKLRFGPLATLMLRGYGGVYALEETSEEVLSKVVGLLRSEGEQNAEIIEAVLGLRSIPRFTTTMLSIVMGLLIKLPLSILLTLLAFALVGILGRLYPELVEVRTPAFALIVFSLIVAIFYILGGIIARKKFG